MLLPLLLVNQQPRSLKGTYMLIAMSTVFFGVLILWQFSTIVGTLMIVVGLGLIGRQYVQEPTRSEPRDYASSAPTYNLSSKPRR